MPDTDRRRPRAATCEDWDDDAQTTLPGSRTTANVSIKRSDQDLIARQREVKLDTTGVDSGYVSRANTLVNEPTSIRRRTNDLKIETTAGILERERQPYHMPQSAPIKPPSRRQSSSQPIAPAAEPRLSKEKYAHKRGTCWTCDNFGSHLDEKDMLPASGLVPLQPKSPTTVKAPVTGRSKDDAFIQPKVKRSSSMREQRPLSVVTNTPNIPQYAAPPVYATPVLTASTWVPPVNPLQYATGTYTYVAPAQHPPPAPIGYQTYQRGHMYHEPTYLPEQQSAKPSRRSSPMRQSTLYGDPVIKPTYIDSGFPALEKVPSKNVRSSPVPHKSQRSIDQDRMVMPPPPKPQYSDVGPTRRPSNHRSKTYHPEDPPLREQSSREHSRYDEDYDDYPEVRQTISSRARRESPSLPPTSYKGPAVIDTRPALPRKSVSYSTTETTTKVASSKSNAHRRTTLPSVPMEQKTADAEAYQQKRGGTTSHLTQEALRDLNKGTSGSRSETGSSYSHKSHQSSSKDSSRGRSYTSGATTSITLPGGLNLSIPANYKTDGRPLSINIGDLTLSMKSQDKEVERHQEQKRIERAPSVASKTSRRSIASSNISNTEVPKNTSRRSSQLDDRNTLSRQHSRAPSATGHSYDYTVSSRGQNTEFTNNKYEDFYGA